MCAAELTFTHVAPSAVAPSLDATSVHLWRMRYAASMRRTPLCELLAAYLDIPASSLVLDEAAGGKPHIAHAASGIRTSPQLDFNWSHSGDWALVAIAHEQALGVDIERLGKPLRASALARRFFTLSEADVLDALTPELRTAAFIKLWCAKEAVLKAEGKGLAFGLDRLAFAATEGADWALERLDPAFGVPTDWQLSGFAPAAGYRGSLAWRGVSRRISTYAFAPSDAG